MTCTRLRVSLLKFFPFVMVLTLLFSGNTVFAQGDAESGEGLNQELWDSGKSLFRGNCASCHHPINDGTGPALEGSLQRWEDNAEFDGISGKDWLYEWIRNNQAVLDAGNPYALEMYAEWAPEKMNLFPALTDDDIAAILYYVDRSTAGAKPTDTGEGEEVVVAKDSFPMTLFLALVVGTLIILLLILLRINRVLRKMEAEKRGVELPEPTPIWKNRKLGVLVILLGVVFLGYVTLDGATNLGRQQGYQPDQPIKFSHELHAGLDKIDCQYCHYGANESKHSNIPSVSTCMNCHKVIQQGPKHGRQEIGKIYAANAYNPLEGAYITNPEELTKEEIRDIYKEYLEASYEETELAKESVVKAMANEVDSIVAMFNKPVEWVRIHNLPDHVYFNHAQHVNAGNVECQTCHGPVEEMEVLYQHAPLSMGWCINCHRETAVDFSSNDYYSVYERFHEQLENEEIDQVTVEDVGGTECQKCHY